MFGGVVALFLLARELSALTGPVWAVVVLVAVIAGLMAMRNGDEFWRSISQWFHWW